jgi:hypothetical protein
MGHNDRIEDDYPQLPDVAGETTRKGFEPDNEWLKSANLELCHEAMRQWFASRYWDPANDTPYNGREGGYIYVHGGPFDAEEELYERFGGLMTDESIRSVVDDVESDGIYEWAPIHTEPDYDAEFEIGTATRDASYNLFMEKLYSVDVVASLKPFPDQQSFLLQLLYSSLITALEAYLAETMSYWLEAESHVFRQFVSSCNDFKQQKLPLASIFDRMDSLKEEVETYLGKQVWHRIDKVMPLVSASLCIQSPDIEPIMKHILVRHDIVHRGGRKKNGDIVVITPEQLADLREKIVTFVDEIEVEIERQFPVCI